MKNPNKFYLIFVLLLVLVLSSCSSKDPAKLYAEGDAYSAVLTSLQSKYYGLVHLALATTAYADIKDKKNIADTFRTFIEKTLPTLPAPQGFKSTFNPKWKLEWGPAVAEDNSNLVCVVTCGPPNEQPYFRAVILRGTDISAKPRGLINQLFQDLSAYKQKIWSKFLDESLGKYNVYGRSVDVKDTSIHVASGSADALKKVLGLKLVKDASGSGTLIEHLQSVHAENTPLVVTGHSLGGALTQVVSAFIAWQLKGAFQNETQPVCDSIFPNAFAPPTVGDSSFAAAYDKLFPSNYFWFNISDVVPKAYVCIDSVKLLWGSYAYKDSSNIVKNGASFPNWLEPTLDTMEAHLPKNYARPTNNQLSFKADYLPKPNKTAKLDPWLGELIYQHFPKCYYDHISKVSGLAPYNPFNF